MSSEKDLSALETEPIGHLIVRLAIPCIASQLISLIYNVIDRIYLGHLSFDHAHVLAGVGLVAPLLTVINAFSGLVGTGGGPLATISMGQNDKEKAEHILYNSFMVLIFFSLLITVLLFLFEEKLLFFLGADENNIIYAKQYLNIYGFGTIFVMLVQGLTPFLLTQGFNKESMIYTLIGVIVNIVLDPLFIYGFKMSAAGAALASVISQLLSAILIVKFLFGDKTIIRIVKSDIDIGMIGNILGLGVSTFFMMITSSIVQTLYYKQLGKYGDSNHIAAMSIIYTITQFIFLISNGIGQGAQPVMSYNYGAKNVSRLKASIKWVNIASIVFGCIIQLLIMAIPEQLFAIFTTDAKVVELGVRGIRLFVFGKGISSVQFGMQYVFRAIGDAKTAMYNATVRKIIFIIPFLILLPEVGGLGVDGVYLAEALGDIFAGINVTVVYMIRRKKIFKIDQVCINS